jgi:predicted DNA-binding transcriptional regulator AlpA
MTNPYEPKTVTQILDAKIGGPDAPYRQAVKHSFGTASLAPGPMRLARMLKIYVATHEGGLTQKQVAKEAGMSEASLSRFLTGEQMPDGRSFGALVAWCFGEHRAYVVISDSLTNSAQK